MKWIITFLMVAWFSFGGFHRISTINQHIENAYETYFNRDFKSTIFSINFLTDSLSLKHNDLSINKAHATYLLTQKNNPGIVAGDTIVIKELQQALDLYK